MSEQGDLVDLVVVIEERELRVKVLASLVKEMDAIIEEHRGDFIPPTRSSIVEHALREYFAEKHGQRND